ncbi:MAG: bifunctional 23S rRNA (guanine(2069)-N(7))-methyltransferase RlmK/23S rRNA (guanine(2445)-N(2))-methyltransferase RlmL [Succinivibrio sp.]|nr:bifunctional 23S rRNA (guanine(2069)-N(7))-methyltransferase RlmK/23S rRNA (guanine(2445)-N(2))-methyltransferase RlmL [Succinivibrio sp.]
MSVSFFATCPKGLESLLLAEVAALGVFEPHETVAGVSFKGEFATGLKVCLWSRFASRVLLELSEFNCADDTDLYLAANGVAWEKWFTPAQTIAVDFNGVSETLRNTQYSALKIKDAICDRLQKTDGGRPSVDRNNPDVQIYAHLERRGIATIALDLSGRALLKREINRTTGAAPLKENLAAAMVVRSGYDGGNFFDPMCGSGTLLLEAAAIATDTAPGLKRKHFGFFKLKQFDEEVWKTLVSEASVRSSRGIAKAIERGIEIRGNDQDGNIVDIANFNAEKAGFASLVKVSHCALASVVNPFGQDNSNKVTIVTNPPYGRRMGNFNELISLYTLLGSQLKTHFKGARAAVISTSQELLSCLRLHSDKVYRLYNGELECQLRVFNINMTGEQSPKELLRGRIAEDFANRLRKNLTHLRKWAARENINAYRIYDADVPEYAAAIDYYNGWYVIQAYEAPKSVNPKVARQHVLDMISATVDVTGSDGSHVILKQRSIKKGDEQYEKALEQKHNLIEVNEDNRLFYVNLEDYLDTGLFLDGRLIRQKIQELSKDRDVLNLFAYTCSASVSAALGGARSTHSVDMSRTYLQWGMDNFRLNNLSLEANTFEQADCLNWVSRGHDRQFDLIYADPPTFSNSKRMERSFDVKRDQVALLSNLTRHLKDRGTVIFCTNHRGFKLDTEALTEFGFVIEDISKTTLPEDFSRDAKIHSCFMLHFDRSTMTAQPQAMTEFRTAPRWSGELKAFDQKKNSFSGDKVQLKGGSSGNSPKRGLRDHHSRQDSGASSYDGRFAKRGDHELSSGHEFKGTADRSSRRRKQDRPHFQRKVRVWGPDGVKDLEE